MGPEPLTKYLGLIPIVAQFALMMFIKDLPWVPFLILTWSLGSTVTHTLFLLIHEVTHFLAFKNPYVNDLYSMLANTALPIPYAMMFKMYHQEHHRYQGWDGIDADVPMDLEAKVLSSFPGKLFFCTFQILFYAFRPMFVKSQKVHRMVVVNWIVVLAADVLVYYVAGVNGLFYLLMTVLLSGMFHPMAGHFIAEHYIRLNHPTSTQETFSYYGPWNFFGWNVGLHNEHHDFPNVPWSRLPQLRKIAPEFYEPLIKCESWPMTTFQFLFHSDVNLYNRVKREKGAGSRVGPLLKSQ
jgi:sphingolipid 4-desaturase/C4-monooxygenase